MNKQITQSQQSFGGMNKKLLGMGLGMTFFMFGIQMQLRRMLGSMSNIFEESQNRATILNDKFNIIRANLGALAISFMDALQQSPLFDFLIGAVSALTNWFLDLDDATQQWISEFVLKSVGIIGIIGVGGQILLGLNTILDTFGKVESGWAKIGAMTAAVLTISLVMDSLEDFARKDIVQGLIDAMGAISGSIATYGFLTGKLGVAGTFLTLAVALKLVKEDVFFRALFGVLGTLTGIIAGALNVIKDQVIYYLKLAIFQIYQTMPFFVRASLGLVGINPEDPKPVNMKESFEAGFGPQYGGAMVLGEKLDTWVAAMKENTNALIKSKDTYKDYNTPPDFNKYPGTGYETMASTLS